ncbi:putative signal peptide-containing protein [Cryptosporidium canis]|uniref:Signal peptide-containing protein n=1 Tax=Cryptosporidium canis TaxID=195482 RepID=A0ABQ8PC70_9CRYT|nr:putative signal peptide-containing protein [Cryptosporidium canis]KAJ1615346.1 putative signal peptide-containing protein [Cryptosporidium canis]
MSRRRQKLNISKTSSSQNIQLLIVWTIFLGIVILFFHLIYKYCIKKVLEWIGGMIGVNKSSVNSTNNGNLGSSTQGAERGGSGAVHREGGIHTSMQDASIKQSASSLIGGIDDSQFRVSMGFCFNKETDHINQPKVKDSLHRLSSLTDFFLFVQVDTDQDEKIVLDYMNENGIFDAGLRRHRLLFCEKPESISSMARQLQANMHIDTDEENLQKLANRVPNVSIISLGDDGKGLSELVDSIENITTKKIAS